MPNVSVPTGQDWGSVNVGNTAGRKVVVPKKAADLSRAKAAGLVSTQKKYEGGKNTSAHAGAVNARKLEESDELKHAKVDRSLSKAIMQARTAKKMTQKDLGTKINEKPQVVAEYESGKAIPNPQLISKIERALGCKLPRPGKKPSAPKSKTGAAGGAGRGGPSHAMRNRLTTGGPAKRR